MSRTISLPVKDTAPMNAYVATPAGTGPFPAIIVYQEAFGVNHHIQAIADKLAGEGYIAVAPELYHRTAPAGFEARYYQFPLVAPHFQAVTTETIIEDSQAVYDWLQAQGNVVKDKIGVIGFCLGGRAAFIANTAIKFAAAVSYYGGYMHTVADRAATANGPQLLFWGGKDQHILPEHVKTVVDAFKRSGKDYISVEISYADHAFFCDERDSYHPQAAKESWGITKEFLKNKLQS